MLTEDLFTLIDTIFVCMHGYSRSCSILSYILRYYLCVILLRYTFSLSLYHIQQGIFDGLTTQIFPTFSYIHYSSYESMLFQTVYFTSNAKLHTDLPHCLYSPVKSLSGLILLFIIPCKSDLILILPFTQ